MSDSMTCMLLKVDHRYDREYIVCARSQREAIEDLKRRNPGAHAIEVVDPDPYPDHHAPNCPNREAPPDA